MDKIQFSDGTKISNAKVTIDNVDYTVTPARYNGATPLSSTVLNTMQDNIEDAIDLNAANIGGEEYDSTATYYEGDVVTHNALLYRAKQDIDTAEEWTAEHWEETSVIDELANTSGNEIAYGLDNITRQSKAVVYPTNYRTVNQEVNIGTTNPSNTRTWFKKSKNLFDKNSMVLNASINAANSQLSSSNDYRTIFIKCKPNTIYKYSQSVSSNRYTVGYTSDTNLTLPKTLTNVSASHTFTTASDTQYIFIMVSNITTDTSNINDILNSAMLNEGETALPYEPYINSSINIDNKPFTETVNVGIDENNSKVWFKKSRNLFDESLLVGTGIDIKYLQINVKPNTNYTLSTDAGNDITANVFLSLTGSDVTTANNGARPNNPRTMNSENNTIMYLAYRDNLTSNWVQLEEGSVATPYEPYIVPTINVDGDEIYNKEKSYIHCINNANYTISADSTYERFPTKVVVSKRGNGFSLNTTTGIITTNKAGIIRVSGNINFTTIATTGIKWINLYVGSANRAVTNSYGVQGQRLSLSLTPIIMKVNAGTSIYLQVYGNTGDVIRGDNTVYSYITCEYID